MGCIYRRKKKLPDGTKIETGPYWIKYYRNGRAMSESTESEKESEAKRQLRLREGDIERGVPLTQRVGRVSMEELFRDLKNDYLKNELKSVKKLNGMPRKPSDSGLRRAKGGQRHHGGHQRLHR